MQKFHASSLQFLLENTAQNTKKFAYKTAQFSNGFASNFACFSCRFARLSNKISTKPLREFGIVPNSRFFCFAGDVVRNCRTDVLNCKNKKKMQSKSFAFVANKLGFSKKIKKISTKWLKMVENGFRLC
ncbi:MAG: hypothetical protein IKC52_04135 [Clostridia bacterium]|nr:hypothetical protein [Clostridia bacterium]